MKLFRLMKMDVDGKPRVGSGSMMLGVRPYDPSQPHKRADVLASQPNDIVQAGSGGLSCYSDPAKISIRSKHLILWSIEVDLLSHDITVVLDGGSHYLIEPTVKMELSRFQSLLFSTRDFWQIEPGEEP